MWKFVVLLTVLAVLLAPSVASACTFDSDCDTDYVCCSDGSCYFSSCPSSSSGCVTDSDCSSGDTCCSDGTCATTCGGSSSTCDTSQTDCGSYCCDASYSYCCSDGTCADVPDCAACPVDEPVDCGDGTCCDDVHPYCCADGTCSIDSSCTITISGTLGNKKSGAGGKAGGKDWGCDIGVGRVAGAPWLAIVAAVCMLALVARSKRRNRAARAGALLVVMSALVTFGCMASPVESSSDRMTVAAAHKGVRHRVPGVHKIHQKVIR